MHPAGEPPGGLRRGVHRRLPVQAGERRDEGDTVAVEVRDYGSGVADSESIFEPFFTSKTDGMGMGLAISRSIVEAHNGRIRVAKAHPKGTAFTVILPVHAAPMPAKVDA